MAVGAFLYSGRIVQRNNEQQHQHTSIKNTQALIEQSFSQFQDDLAFGFRHLYNIGH